VHAHEIYKLLFDKISVSSWDHFLGTLKSNIIMNCSTQLRKETGKLKFNVYIVEHNTHENVERNAEEIHDCAPSLLRNVLRSHFHNRWPKYSHASLKGAEAEELDITRKRDTPTFHRGRCH